MLSLLSNFLSVWLIAMGAIAAFFAVRDREPGSPANLVGTVLVLPAIIWAVWLATRDIWPAVLSLMS